MINPLIVIFSLIANIAANPESNGKSHLFGKDNAISQPLLIEVYQNFY